MLVARPLFLKKRTGRMGSKKATKDITIFLAFASSFVIGYKPSDIIMH